MFFSKDGLKHDMINIFDNFITFINTWLVHIFSFDDGVYIWRLDLLFQ